MLDPFQSFASIGFSVANLGDVNGDRVPDHLIGAPDASTRGRNSNGAVYVVYGRATPGTINLALVGLLPDLGYRVDGARDDDRFGSSVAAMHDLNGDLVPDMVIGAPGADPRGRALAGAVTVLYGLRGAGGVDTRALGSKGFTVFGAKPGDYLGAYVADGTGFSGAGRPRLVLSAVGSRVIVSNRAAVAGRSASSGEASQIYVVRPSRPGKTEDLQVGDSVVVRLLETRPGVKTGTTLVATPDLNCDGARELLIASSLHRAYLVYGRALGKVDLGRPFAGLVIERRREHFGWGVAFLSSPGHVGDRLVISDPGAFRTAGDDVGRVMLHSWNRSAAC